VVQSVFGLYGADFFGMSLGLDAAIAFLHLSGLVLAAWALCRVLRRFFGCEDRIAQVLAVAILINVAAYVWSPVPSTYWSAREMAGEHSGAARQPRRSWLIRASRLSRCTIGPQIHHRAQINHARKCCFVPPAT
jgi:hypothetical protein